MEPQEERIDADQTAGRGIDALFGYLIIALGVLGVFVLGIVGLGQMQRVNQRAVRDEAASVQPENNEIGGNLPADQR
jgi:hypothetical protein